MQKYRYNIALLPVRGAEKVVRLSGEFANIAEGYRLGSHSLPHVTLCQFVAYPVVLEDLWRQVCTQTGCVQVELTFRKLSFTTSDQQVYWIALVPDEREMLQELHEQVTGIIGQPLNRAYANYDPHMTLVNTKNSAGKNLLLPVEKAMQPLRERFVLSLGKADALWQYREVLYRA